MMEENKEIKEQIRTYKEQGMSYVDVGKIMGMSARDAGRFLTIEERERYAEIAARQKAKVRKEKKQLGKYKKEDKFLLNVRENKRKLNIFSVDDAGEIDLWDYPNDYKKFGYKDLRVMEGLFGMSTLNIPFVHFQPAKRIQTISHGLLSRSEEIETETVEAKERRYESGGFRWSKGAKPHRIANVKYHGQKLFFGTPNFVKLDKPELPLVEVERHDVDTLNATVGFADSHNDRLLTQEDSCFVSTEFAQRFTYTVQKKAIFFTTKQMSKEVEVKEGECIETIKGDEHLTKKNIVKQTGTFRYTKQTQRGILWVNYGLITSKKHLGIGDKILGLSGLKVTVCDVRDQNDNKDIVIHPKQILSKPGKENIKGAMVKELQECGKIMVGIRKDEVLGTDENSINGGSVSSILYPVLKLYAPKMLSKIIKQNSSMPELLKSLHLTYSDGRIKLTDEEIDGSEFAGHYLWDAKLLDDPKFFVGDKKEYEQRDFSGEWKEKGILKMHYWSSLIWSRLYIPQFVDTGWVSKGEWKNALFVDYIASPFDSNLEKYGGKYPFLQKKKAKTGEKANSEYNKIVEEIFFCHLKSGAFLRALPTLETDKIVLHSSYKEKYGDSCIIYREPVVSKDNVYSVNVKYDDKMPLYCVRIPINLVKAANGDYDGDGWAVIPYNDCNLNISSHKIKNILPDMTPIDLDTIEIKERTKQELVEEAIAYRKNKTEEGILTKEFGGVRNHAAFTNNDIEVQKQILELASYLEVALKTERQTKEWKQDMKEKIHLLKSFIPKEIAKKNIKYGDYNLYQIVKKHWDDWKGLVGYKPQGFWFDLFCLPTTEEDKKMQALDAGKKIVLGEI